MCRRRRRKTPVVRECGPQSAGYIVRRNREPPRRRVPPSSCLPALALAPLLVLPRSPSCHPLTPRRDSIICSARKIVLRYFCRRDAAQFPDRLAPVLRLLLPRSPRRLSPFRADVHSPAREFRLRLPASTPHQMPASPPSIIRP